mgnify:CR=1 FL=1
MNNFKWWYVVGLVLLVFIGAFYMWYGWNGFAGKSTTYFVNHPGSIQAAERWCKKHPGHVHACMSASRARVVVDNPMFQKEWNAPYPLTEKNMNQFYADHHAWEALGESDMYDSIQEQERDAQIFIENHPDNLFLKWQAWCKDMYWKNSFYPKECISYNDGLF